MVTKGKVFQMKSEGNLPKESGKLPNRVERRFESASLVWDGSPIIPIGFARPNATFGWRDSAFWTNLAERRKFLPSDATRADSVLEISGFRGWENPAKRSRRGTGWAPAPEFPRFLALRPRGGGRNFLLPEDFAL